ncbi:hypothetical protein PROFUN_05891 [Planoprotostelium fungivorum]|uniref:Homeobox domain-containing protein n=1 Tax=Planoprotostelium fungivorum TaxID=1890364 RepID=A0A2P6NKU8_9EUKA|nr:hypothetical protein PROFUN_05891 [Planoprotostelium fungivorum]
MRDDNQTLTLFRDVAFQRQMYYRRQTRLDGDDGRRRDTRASPNQVALLEAAFEKSQRLTREERKKLATEVDLSERRVRIWLTLMTQTWYQNRRSKMSRMKRLEGIEDREEDDLSDYSPSPSPPSQSVLNECDWRDHKMRIEFVLHTEEPMYCK